MGCPGQARTKPRRKIQPSQRRRKFTGRRPPAGGHHQRSAQRKAARSSRLAARIIAHVAPNDGATCGLHVATRAAWPRQGGAPSRPIIATMLRGSRAIPATSVRRSWRTGCSPLRNILREDAGRDRPSRCAIIAQGLQRASAGIVGHRAAMRREHRTTAHAQSRADDWATAHGGGRWLQFQNFDFHPNRKNRLDEVVSLTLKQMWYRGTVSLAGNRPDYREGIAGVKTDLTLEALSLAGNSDVTIETPLLAGAWLRTDSRGIWHFKVGGGRSP
ncbi:hypothetical protein F511_17925 [Dorcoceras hygrometricum]|uniref:Uncharacterized protein n=1 Tax=Dorcoceras hygrometricum TaxID=472368 RepID=A0A2Z7BF93_9LAMI|nr:hypothetical protein F511_17925 [Dorcoceras hygrometricum]